MIIIISRWCYKELQKTGTTKFEVLELGEGWSTTEIDSQDSPMAVMLITVWSGRICRLSTVSLVCQARKQPQSLSSAKACPGRAVAFAAGSGSEPHLATGCSIIINNNT